MAGKGAQGRERVLVSAAVALAVVMAGAGPARAKAFGFHDVTIRGDGLAQPLVLRWREFGMRGGAESPGMVATNELLRRDPKSDSRPGGVLGGRFELVYEFQTFLDQDIGSFQVEQFLYPYASAGPVTFTPAGQSYRIGSRYPEHQVRSGWVSFPPRLVRVLQSRGLPVSDTNPEGPWAWFMKWAVSAELVPEDDR